MPTFKEKLRLELKGDITDDDKVLAEYSRDASLFTIKPRLVVFPKDVEDIKILVRLAREENARGGNISLTPRSAGTDMTGGPLTESVVVEMTKYLNHIKEIGTDYAILEPGVYYRDFEKATLAKNLFLPSYPASRDICTLGGMVANNSGGEKTLAYGKTEKYVESVTLVAADGNAYEFKSLTMEELGEKLKLQTFEGDLYRKIYELITKNYDVLQKAKPEVSKNSAGFYLWNVFDKERGTFDLAKLITGSQGTLGIITEIKLRLVRPKQHSRLLVIFLRDTKHLAEIVQKILPHHPESFESYDDHTFALAFRFFPELARRMGAGIFSLALQFLPEVFMILSGGMPKLVLLAEFTAESGDEALRKAQEARESLKNFHFQTKVTQNEEAGKKYWVIRRESFNLLRHHVRGMRTAPFIDDMVVRPEFLPEFLPKLYAILNQYKIVYTVAGHVGDGNFHIIPLMDFKRPESKKIIAELAPRVYDLVLRYGGSITGEHNDGLIRGPYLKQMFGEKVYALFEQTKKIFDPENIFNPGKKVGVNLSYTLDHIQTE